MHVISAGLSSVHYLLFTMSVLLDRFGNIPPFVNATGFHSQIPSVASYTPSSGQDTFLLTSNVRIIVLEDDSKKISSYSPSTLDFANTFREDLMSIASFASLPVITVATSSDDVPPEESTMSPVIYLSINSALRYQYFNGRTSPEGYEIQVLPQSLAIRAGAPIGVWWGTRTVLQQIAATLANHNAPVTDINLQLGYLSDFPGWEVRGFMLDAGRHWFETDFLGELEPTEHPDWELI